MASSRRSRRWDTEASCLFQAVQHKKSFAIFFDADDTGPMLRTLSRLESHIEDLLAAEAKDNKARAKTKRHSEAVDRHKKKSKPKQAEEPPPPPMMTLGEAAAASFLSTAAKTKKQRDKLLTNGYTRRFQPPQGAGGRRPAAHQVLPRRACL